MPIANSIKLLTKICKDFYIVFLASVDVICNLTCTEGVTWRQ